MRVLATCSSRRRTTRHICAATFGSFAVATAVSVAQSIPDFARNPPRVESVAIQFLDPPSFNALLFVTYARDARLAGRMPLNFGKQITVLRDDGQDGDEKAGDFIYTGPIHLSVDELRREIVTDGHGKKTVPVFRGRELVGRRTIVPLKIELFEKLVRHRDKIVLDTYGTCSTDPIDWKKSLLITDSTVLQDQARTYDQCAKAGQRGTPTGHWSFPYIIRELAGGASASNAAVSNFIRDWLNQWKSATSLTVNGWPVPNRAKIVDRIITPWKTASVGTGMEFDPAKAPFRLLAIVNRIDKSDTLIYGRSGAPSPSSAGELRFVFGAMSESCAPLHFTVIVEFGVDRKDCVGITAWAKDWIALSQLSFGATYNQNLAALSDQIVPYGSAPARPNKSALNQIRTNESSLEDANGGATWDMREFHLNDTNQLVIAPVDQTPDGSLNGSTVLKDYINANATAIKTDMYDVPLEYPTGTHFLGGSIFALPAIPFWQAAGITDNDARFHFSLNTCNGCHARETGTASTHIKPSVTGSLSPFLLGGPNATVNDPVVSTTTHTFADLDRREQELAAAAKLSCVCQLFHAPIDALH